MKKTTGWIPRFLDDTPELHTPKFRKPTPPPPPFERLRPCEIDGKTCVFHGWIAEDKALLKINAFMTLSEMGHVVQKFRDDGVIAPGCSTEIVHGVFALVEYPDGSVGKVDPSLVTFLNKEVK